MNFFKEINQLSVKYDTPSTRGCYNELLALFTDYLKALETQLVKQSKQPVEKSCEQQVKETGHIYDFGHFDALVRKHFPKEAAQLETAIKQKLASEA